ncbi:MAG: AAA domain-containing protein [Cyclobacteriaceae bacterium]
MAKKDHHILNSYLRKLTNLSSNNRSIYLPRINSDQFIDLHSLSQLNGEKSFSIIEALIAGKSKMLCPVIDSRMEVSNEGSKKVKKLERLDHLIFEERGSKDLHIGWPFAHGKFIDGTLVRCPLLYIPVKIYAEKQNWFIALRQDADIAFNKSFLLGYSFYNKIPSEDFLLEETFEETDRDSTVFRTTLYQLLQKSSIDIHFNPDNYRDELTTFQSFTKVEFEEVHGNGELKLYPEAVLGIFPQSGSYLVPDYIDLIENNKIKTLEEFFAGKNHAEQQSVLFSNFIPLVKEEKVFTGYPQDAWQENILKGVKIGYSVVVQGPPGTGKSQLISNLICDITATGKKVLVVCQKRAALDVVFDRLKKVHLADFAALVHDFKNDRKEIFAKAAKQIERVDEYKAKNNSLDSIQMERKFLQVSHRIDQIVEELDDFKKNLFNDTECGATIKELYLRSNPNEQTINLKQEYQSFPLSGITEFVTKLGAYAHYAAQFELDDHPWKERISFLELGVSDQKEIQTILTNIPLVIGDLFAQLSEQVGAKLDWEQCEELLERESEISEMLTQLRNKETYHYLQSMIEETEEETSALWLSNIERIAMECFEGEGPEATLPTAQLGTLQQALYRTMKARRSLIGLIRWELFSKDKFLIKRALVGNDIENNKKGFKILEQKLDRRLNLEHNLSKLRSKEWLKDLPTKIDAKVMKTWFTNQKNAIRAKEIFKSIRGITNFVDLYTLDHKAMSEKLKGLFKILSIVPGLKIKWGSYLSSKQISMLTKQPERCALLFESIGRDFDALCEYDRIKNTLTPDEKNTISKLFDVYGAWNADGIKNTFINSLCLAWIDHIETKYPILRMVSSGKLGLLESELDELMMEKQKIGNEILLMRARERVADDLEFNRLNNRVTYRDLLHQLTKKKRIWPIRKLVSEFEEEIFRLLPCWLASPESVSAIFPMREMFDVVIFDEASQCFAERGIPAMYRGKQVIVAGDSKQLRPNDLYRIRWEDEDEVEPDLEVDSLLELTSRYLMELPLKTHYRSRALELIDFSNRHFYDGQLTLLPDFKNYKQYQNAVQYVKVDGHWEGNTNLVEAEHIAALVLTITKATPEKEIGIVTFNAPQQMLILDLIDEAFAQSKTDKPASLIVKNIENVQGDEKDIIIFSIGYGPDQKGKFHAQFGSLNVEGGENRLNVAITRARERVIVVASILPGDLHVEEAKNEGPKLLKAYLQYVKDTSEGKFKPYSKQYEPYGTSWYLKDIIKAWGINKFPESEFEDDALPFTDVSIQLQNSKVGLVLTDDELYRQNPSVKDLHASIPNLLESKNWKHARYFSRNYWQDREKFFNDVAKFTSQ